MAAIWRSDSGTAVRRTFASDSLDCPVNFCNLTFVEKGNTYASRTSGSRLPIPLSPFLVSSLVVELVVEFDFQLPAVIVAVGAESHAMVVVATTSPTTAAVTRKKRMYACDRNIMKQGK